MFKRFKLNFIVEVKLDRTGKFYLSVVSIQDRVRGQRGKF